ncbi:amino acid racemase [Hwanghaeella grinnelliae]|uniref:Amino acid racemase n=1 Tax=Hwanghaeella grinnelliae TaxID=2500179 RepID=A0A3S2VMQ0_9PROT|nr:amino acid racemase [Hwanghaeella grinnelliae]RVU34134.1 amino acid racemase [Hwanghaeella grinnelliae]
MKKIGLIGGLSWISTAAYYRLLNQMTNQALGGVHSAHLILESVDRQRYVDHVIHDGDEAAACAMILETAKAVQSGGADFIVITCNDVHRFVPQIAPHLSIPFLHIAEATGQSIKRAGLKRVALMGVRKTMEGSFYQSVLSSLGIETMVPEAQERDYIDKTIMEEMVKDRFLPETKSGYVELIKAFHKRGAEGVVLGCTEIPLLLDAGDVEVPTFATTDLHCRAAVQEALA